MKKINEIPQLRGFLAKLLNYFVCNNFYLNEKNIKSSLSEDFWKEKLNSYAVVDRCKCNSFDFIICSTIQLKCSLDKDDFLEGSFSHICSLGTFIIHVDEKGRLFEIELLFSNKYKNPCPPFLKDLIRFFPDKVNPENDKNALEKIKSFKQFSLKNLKEEDFKSIQNTIVVD